MRTRAVLVSCWVPLAALGVVGLLPIGCDTNCIEQVCEPRLFVVGQSSSEDFPPGDITIAFEADGRSFDCVTPWPESAARTSECGPAEVAYLRAQVCSRLEMGLTGISCTRSGPWTLNLIFRSDPPAELQLFVTWADGTLSQRRFTPAFAMPDPDREDCGSCPTTQIDWELP